MDGRKERRPCRLHRVRRVTGILFVLVGIYYALRFIFGLWA